MRALVPGLGRHPLALDLRLNAEVELPDEVAREVERAATVLTRVSALPYGTAAWKAYQRRFYERYGIGTMVPLAEVVSDSGTGFPDGYPGAGADGRRSRVSVRDDTLVRLAQAAVLDGRDEVVLTEELFRRTWRSVCECTPPARESFSRDGSGWRSRACPVASG